jgi:hypothetical protein
MMENDTYVGKEWNKFYDRVMLSRNRKIFRYGTVLRKLYLPSSVIRFCNEVLGSPPAKYTTVVCNLKEFKTDKKVRYALNHFPAEVKTSEDFDRIGKYVSEYRKTKGLISVDVADNLKQLNSTGKAKTFVAMRNGELVGTLTIAEGVRWITELIAAGEQDAIKMHVIDRYKSTHDYYDLSGYDGSERARFKKKWGDVTEVIQTS